MPSALPAPVYCQRPDGRVAAGPLPLAVLPGSFNPLHHGHRLLAAAAERVLGVPVAFELSVRNVDKPDLPADEVFRRLRQFVGAAPVWVTGAARFVEKVELFPGAAFVLGHDTAVRLVDPRYYGGDPAARDAALRALLDRGGRVVVGGRADPGGAFRTWAGDGVGADFRRLFLPLTEADFRADVSSSELRKRQ